MKIRLPLCLFLLAFCFPLRAEPPAGLAGYYMSSDVPSPQSTEPGREYLAFTLDRSEKGKWSLEGFGGVYGEHEARLNYLGTFREDKGDAYIFDFEDTYDNKGKVAIQSVAPGRLLLTFLLTTVADARYQPLYHEVQVFRSGCGPKIGTEPDPKAGQGLTPEQIGELTTKKPPAPATPDTLTGTYWLNRGTDDESATQIQLSLRKRDGVWSASGMASLRSGRGTSPDFEGKYRGKKGDALIFDFEDSFFNKGTMTVSLKGLELSLSIKLKKVEDASPTGLYENCVLTKYSDDAQAH